MRTPAKGKSCGLLPMLPDCKYSVPCASLCNDHNNVRVPRLEKKKKTVNGMAQLRSARNWTFLYARSLTKSCRPCHSIRCLKMLKALLPPGLSCPPISSEAMRAMRSQHLRAATLRTYPTLTYSPFTEPGGRQYQLISSTNQGKQNRSTRQVLLSFFWTTGTSANGVKRSMRLQSWAGLRNHCEEDMFLVMQTKHMFLWPIDCWRH